MNRTQGFTIMELLIVVSLVSILIVSALRSYHVIVVDSALSKARNIVDTSISSASINALTGKSQAAAYREDSETTAYQVSRYFLYLSTPKEDLQSSEIYYGELQKYQDTEYKLLLLDLIEIPEPVWISKMLFSTTFGQDVDLQQNEIINPAGVFIFFDAPFSKISFLKINNEPSFSLDGGQVPLNALFQTDTKTQKKIIRKSIFGNCFYDFHGKNLSSGQIEIVLQYKDLAIKQAELSESYYLREYVKFNSRNEISHYWD